MTRRFDRRVGLALLSAALATVVAMALMAASGATPSLASGLPSVFDHWTLSGSIEDARFGQTITLPSGATFNGSAVLPPVGQRTGTITGDISIPSFSAPVKLYGIPATLGLSLTERAR